MIGSVTEFQQQIASLGKRAARPAVPEPDAAQIAWAKQVLGRGYQADQRDRLDALRVLEAAGVDGRPHDAALAGDTAPPGTREIAAAMLAREQAGTAHARKAFADRGAAEGPSQSPQPGTPEPQDFGRPYIRAGHAAASPQAGPPRSSPMPAGPPGVPVPVALPHADVQVRRAALPAGIRVSSIPHPIAHSYALGSPSDR